MLSTPLILATTASLLVLIALLEPLARRMQLPHTVLLAAVGVVIGGTATFLLFTPLTDALNEVARLFVFFPVDADVFLFGFLPILLFHAALSLDVRRMIDDAAHIFLLAVVAVVVATLAIGLALVPVSGEALLVCLLLGAIVATTDPVAVLAIFRDLGVPARLVRLVEGESLLNDAAAIALFSILLAALTTGSEITASSALLAFAVAALGGAAAGWVGGLVGNFFLRLTCNARPALITVSIAMPYLVFVTADEALEVSGVVAVIVAGMTMATYGSARVAPDSWQRLMDIWDQIAFWAASLLFVLAALMVPRLLEGLDARDLLSLLVLIVAAFAARAVVLFGFVPVLVLLRLGERVGRRAKLVILWGGLRGAITLALALSITEHDQIPLDQRQFIAVLATGFVLFTILVNGVTLRPFVRALKLDELSPFDRGLRRGVIALALTNVREALGEAARDYDIPKEIEAEARAPYEERLARAAEEAAGVEELSDRERLTLGLIALADQERKLLLAHLRDETVSTPVIADLLGDAQRMGEGARADGRIGYRRAAKRVVGYNRRFRLALFGHRFLGLKGPLNDQLAARFERLVVDRIVLKELAPFVRGRIGSLLGTRIADIIEEIIDIRRQDVAKALDALHLQYPAYTHDLERRLLTRIAVRREEREYADLFEDQLIGAELLSDLAAEIGAVERRLEGRPRLDVGLAKEDLVRQFPLFDGLTPEEVTLVARALKARFAIPGERLIRKGDRGEAVYFISSGAVEVDTGKSKIRLGKGDFVGELSLFYGGRRSADVTTIGYSNLLVLEGEDFRTLLDRNPHIREVVEAVAEKRMRERGKTAGKRPGQRGLRPLATLANVRRLPLPAPGRQDAAPPPAADAAAPPPASGDAGASPPGAPAAPAPSDADASAADRRKA